MDKEKIIPALIFIETNLKNDICLEDIAGVAGYSKFHFARVFFDAVGMTTLDYVRKRRLTKIAEEIACDVNKEKFLYEIAFDYGFNSQRNFSVAFKNEFHVSPLEFQKSKNSLKLYRNFLDELTDFYLVPKYVELEIRDLVVYRNTEGNPQNFWNVYNCKKLSKKLSGSDDCLDYGVSYWDYETNSFVYFIGINAKDAKGDTKGTERLIIPADRYAVFETPRADQSSFVQVIHRTWEFINRYIIEIENSKAYTNNGIIRFETYIESSRVFSETIYIPVRAEGGSNDGRQPKDY